MANPTEPNVRESFEAFFNEWLIRQQTHLDQLLIAIAPENVHKTEQHTSLIEQVLSHYQQYYQEKSKAANVDVFLFFSPPWFSSFERTLFWIGGFKPSLVFKLVRGSVQDLTLEQEQRIEQVIAETQREEKELTEKMARIQESMAAPPLSNLARRFGRMINGEVTEVDEAIEGRLKREMCVVLASADGLRGKVVGKVVEILSPVQMVRLLAAAAQFQLRVRSWGLQRDSQRAAT